MKNLLLPILLVVAVLGGITWDYYAHSGATWISYVLFFSALAYVALVVINSFRTPKGPAAVLALLMLAFTAASCASTATVLEKPVRTYTDANGWEVVVVDSVARGW